jgi:hypothetical protein
MLMNPYYGDTFSYPWKRGPHENLAEYQEVFSPVFDGALREVVWKTLTDTSIDWLAKFAIVFQAEDES